MKHSGKRLVARSFDSLLVERQLGLEDQPFAFSKRKLRGGDHLSSAFPDADVAGRIDTHIAPIAVHVRGLSKRWHGAYFTYQLLDVTPAHAVRPLLKQFVGLAFPSKGVGQDLNGLGNSLGRNG